MTRGSITVFFSAVLVSIMSLLFVMGECIRLYELQSFAQEYTDMAVESAFSEYNPYLWTNYKILAVDLGYGTENNGPGVMEQKTLDYCKCNADLKNEANYARLIGENCAVEKYALLTDKRGAGVINLGVKAAKDGMSAQIIDGIQAKSESVNGIEKIPVALRIDFT